MASRGTSHLVADNEKVLDLPDYQKKQKKGWIFPPQAMNIIWGGDNRYWNIQGEGAELVQVSWMEVTGSTKNLVLEEGTYEVSFKVSLKQGAFGWNEFPVFMMTKLGKKGKANWKKINELMNEVEPVKNIIIPKEKLQITVNRSDEEKTIYFGLYEVWSGKWKGGLIIHEARIEPVYKA